MEMAKISKNERCPVCGEPLLYGYGSFDSGSGGFARNRAEGKYLDYYCPNNHPEGMKTISLFFKDVYGVRTTPNPEID